MSNERASAMTVAHLISRLSEMPRDALAVFEDYTGVYHTVDNDSNDLEFKDGVVKLSLRSASKELKDNLIRTFRE